MLAGIRARLHTWLGRLQGPQKVLAWDDPAASAAVFAAGFAVYGAVLLLDISVIRSLMILLQIALLAVPVLRLAGVRLNPPRDLTQRIHEAFSSGLRPCAYFLSHVNYALSWEHTLYSLSIFVSLCVAALLASAVSDLLFCLLVWCACFAWLPLRRLADSWGFFSPQKQPVEVPSASPQNSQGGPIQKDVKVE